MTSFALPLIILSAILHASWNLIAKRTSTTGVALVFLFSVTEVIVFFPVVAMAIYSLWIGTLSWGAIGFILGSGALHTIYFWLLSTGYKVGDLSIVYPIARSTGPLLATIGAIVLFSENPTLIVIGGTLVICFGVLILTGNPRDLRQSKALPAVTYGLLTGVMVACYTLWDAYAMNQASIPPLVFQGGLSLTRMMVLFPFAIRQHETVQHAWATERWKIGSIAIMSSISYLIILFVLAFSPVSYVAPMRTLSILIGVILGTNLLKEEQKWRRILGASIVVISVIMLNIG